MASASGTGTSPAILFLADRDDVGVRRLAACLDDEYPVARWHFGATETTVRADVEEGSFNLEQPGSTLRSDDLRSADVVLYKRRKLQSRPMVSSTLSRQADQAFSEREWSSLLEGLFLEEERRPGGPLWVNPPSAWALTENKLALLLCAKRLGLRVPALRISTLPRPPAGVDGDVVTKAISADERIDSVRHFPTVRLGEADLARIGDRHLPTPSLVQEYVAPVREHRAYYMLGEVFALTLRPSSDHVDIRYASVEAMAPAVERLPTALEAALAALARHFDLAYCAFDLLSPAEGETMLVDVTPAGSWDYFETDDAPFVSEALAAAVDRHLRATAAARR